MTDGELNPEMVANLTAKHTPEQLAAMYLRAELQISKNADEISGHMIADRSLSAKLGAATRELKNLRHAEPLARDITAILKLWRALCSTKRSSIELDGDRAKVVRAALKSKVTGDRKQRRRMCMDAVRGLALRPYVVNAQRKGTGAKEQRYCDIEHALKDEKHIEEHAGFYRLARAKPLEWKERAYIASVDVSARYMDLFLDAQYTQKLEQSRERLRNDPEAVKAHAARFGFTVEQVQASIEGRPVPPADRPKLFVVPDADAA